MKPALNAMLNEYTTVGVQTGVEGATSHQLIAMLLNGALEKIAKASGCMQHGQIAGKGENINWAISIIGGLQDSLDKEQGGEIAANLDRLYTYMIETLSVANAKNDNDKLMEVSALLTTIREAWQGIEEQVKSGAADSQTAAG